MEQRKKTKLPQYEQASNRRRDELIVPLPSADARKKEVIIGIGTHADGGEKSHDVGDHGFTWVPRPEKKSFPSGGYERYVQRRSLLENSFPTANVTREKEYLATAPETGKITWQVPVC